MIYLDNCATTPLDSEVFGEMKPYLGEIFANPSSQHSAGRRAAIALVSARDKIACLCGVPAEKVFFTSGGSEGCNTAVKGVCAKAGKGHLVISAIEHHAVLESARDAQGFGFEVTIVQPDKNGVIRPEEVKKAMRGDTVFCAVMHANNETGVIQPVSEIYGLCKERSVFYFCDCVQTAGVFPLPQADGVCLSAHKFYGPKGFGALILDQPARVARLISGGGQERSFRGGTSNVAGAVGCAAALEMAYARAPENNKRISALRDRFAARVLSEIDGAHVNGVGDKLPGVANFSFDGADGQNIVICLDLEGVCASAGSACSAGAATPSHVISAMAGVERAKSAVRFSFGKYNTESDADFAAEALKRVLKRIRK